jgi:hypothetical protein
VTNEEALRCLANNPSDSQGLESLYTHNRTVIDGTIQKWFGRKPVVPHATRYVLSRIAARTNAFAPEHQTPEAFVAELADEESKGLYEEIKKRGNWGTDP